MVERGVQWCRVVYSGVEWCTAGVAVVCAAAEWCRVVGRVV